MKSPPSRVVAAAAEVRTAATDDSTAVAVAAKSTAMEMVISMQYHVCGAWARRPARVNDQNGHVGGGHHVEAEAREVAAARGQRDGPLRGGESTPWPPFGTARDHLLGRSGRCVALVALAERSRFAIVRGELA